MLADVSARYLEDHRKRMKISRMFAPEEIERMEMVLADIRVAPGKAILSPIEFPVYENKGVKGYSLHIGHSSRNRGNDFVYVNFCGDGNGLVREIWLETRYISSLIFGFPTWKGLTSTTMGSSTGFLPSPTIP